MTYFAILLSIVTFTLPEATAINCYTCHSRNGTDENCHDPYNPALSTYTEQCMEPKKGHIGTFPANFCLKVIGRDVTTGEIMVIRRCTLDNMDNQCGVFKFDQETLRGCILTCNYNGCNRASTLQQSLYLVFYRVLFLLFVHVLST